MEKGDILGHEFMGEVVDLGPDVKNLKMGDRVVVPFTISCGDCFFCKQHMFSACDNSNPKGAMAEKVYGYSGAGLFGFSQMMGGYAGGQAEFVRGPFADIGPLRIPNGIEDEKVLFLSDILPTGYMAAENCGIQPGDVVAVWGCGPVGQFAIQSAFLLGASRVIGIDQIPSRLRMAEEISDAETLDFSKVDVFEFLKETTGGIGPDRCIDAVGLEAHGTSVDALYDRVKVATFLTTDRPHALRQAIQSCRKGGTVSIPGVYAGLVDKFNLGSAFSKGLTLRMGQTHVQKYMPLLLELIQKGRIDPSLIISHRLDLDRGPDAYKMFRNDKGNCTKVVMKPQVSLH